MSLKYKAGMALALFFLLFGGIEYAILHLIIVPKFDALEETAVVKNSNRVLQAIDRELHHLSLLCFDWSAWDDTYRFVEEPSETYIKANLGLSTFTGNTINLIYFYNQKKEVVWGQIRDLETTSALELNAFRPDLTSLLPVFPEMSLENRQVPDVFKKGILMTEQGPMLLASRPIVTSEYKGPVKGVLVMGRFLDSQLVEILKSQTEVAFTIEALPSGIWEPPPLARPVRSQGGTTFYLENLGDQRIAVHTMLSGLSGRPALLLRSVFPREVSQEGKNAAAFALYSFIGAAFLASALGLLLMKGAILSPLSRINRQAQTIARFEEPFASMAMDRGDEIGELSRSVDQMKDNLLFIKDKIQNIIDSMPVILVCIDVRGRVHLVNKAAAEQGVRKKSGEDFPLLWGLIPPFEPFREKVAEVVASGEVAVFHRQHVILARREGYFDVTFYPLVTAEERQAVVLIQDVTRVVRMEQAAVRSEKMMSLGGLAAGMAHEINNPLAGILQNIQLIKSRLTDALPGNVTCAREVGLNQEALREYLEKRKILRALDHISASGTIASEIVGNMLAFAKSDAPDKRSHKVSALLKEAFETLWAGADSDSLSGPGDITIVNEASRSEDMVVCEKSAIVQALVNILKNAVGVLADQPPKADSPRITIEFRKQAGMGEFEIRDNGPGLSETAQKRIFEPFFSTREGDGGAGLGLSLAYFIVVKDHGGQLDVRSAGGQGTVFTVRLPLPPSGG